MKREITNKLVILDVQEYEFWPEMCALRCFNNLDTVCSSATFMTGLNATYLWNIDSGDEELEMLHH